jgi:hypothetical protein
MERSVKTDLCGSPTVLLHGGVRFQSADAARLARVRLARAEWLACHPQAGAEALASDAVILASAGAGEAADHRG